MRTSYQTNSLTSHEAHQRLLLELYRFYNNCKQLKWLECMRNIWPSIVNFVFTVVAIILFLVVTSISTNDIKIFTNLLIQTAVLILIVCLNVFLEFRELKIRYLWHIERCMSQSDNFMGMSPCPWTHKSYPAHPISTLRSEITTRGLRDGHLVNIPCSLLVCGDIIQLDWNTPSPALVQSLDKGTSKDKQNHILEIGETPNSKFHYNRGSEVKLIEQEGIQWFEVIETPIIKLLEHAVEKSPPPSTLYRQKQLLHKIIICIFIPVIFFVAFVFGLSRWLAFREFFKWQDALFLGPIITVLSLLALSLHIVWNLMSAYSIALYNASSMCSPELTTSRTIKEKLNKVIIISRETLKVFIQPYCYPLPEHVHCLGSLTALCAVDKEYLLTGGIPTPEKVFFLRREQGRSTQDREFEINYETASPTDDESSGILFSCGSNVEVNDTNSTFKQLECITENPQLAGSIEIVPETLDVSVNCEHPSGLSFDDPNWSSHMNSLKPIGLNIFATSHAFQNSIFPHHSATSYSLQHYLCKTQCSCSLAYEIGVSEYPAENFNSPHLVYAVGDVSHVEYTNSNNLPKTRSRSLFYSVQNDLVQPHMLSVIIYDEFTKQNLLMSRGSGDLIVWCCRDFWDGEDLQPMTEVERMAISDFFTRRSLSSYCVALAYNPLLTQASLNLFSSKDNIGIYLPETVLQNVHAEDDLPSHQHHLSAMNTLNLLSNQVFLGMISLQYQPKQDVISLVQDLKFSGIRFIHYTAENEVRGKIFAEKLGLEAGWNCHISLSPAFDDESNCDEFEDESASSTGSSLSSVINAYQAYIKAKLPKGVDKIRSHIKNVDNVPLLVPLFTDCTPEAVTEMIKIMQENGEVVLCMGSAWVRENLSIYAQSDIGFSLSPVSEDTVCGCTVNCNSYCGNKTQNWLTPMEAAASLNSLTSGAYMPRDADISIHYVVHQCRHILGCIQRGLLYFLGCSLAVMLLSLCSAVFFQPLPLSGSHIFWILLVTIPLLTLSILSTQTDDKIKSLMPDRKTTIWNKEWNAYIVYFCVLYVPTIFICLTIFWLSLHGMCNSIEGFVCNPVLGNTALLFNATNMSQVPQTLGWLYDNSQGALLAQDCTAFFLTIYLCSSSLVFLHRSEPTWNMWRYLSWQYVVVLFIVIVMQIVYFVVSQTLAVALISANDIVWTIEDIPWYVWILGFLWIIPQLILQELLKWNSRKMFVRTQRKLRLAFETKLGMNSPF